MSEYYFLSNWIQTNSGIQFPVCAPKEECISIKDIAHCLARIQHFNGHADKPISIAEHSIIVSKLAGREGHGGALWGLLHDASEAYICDIPSPLKNTPIMDGYRQLEREYNRAIANRFECRPNAIQRTAVKTMDAAVLAAEAVECFTRGPIMGWTDQIIETVGIEAFNKARKMITNMAAKEAEEKFLRRYYAIVGE